MLKYETPELIWSNCYVNYIYIDGWHHALSKMIREASQQFSTVISLDYQKQVSLSDYQVFTAFESGVWVLGVAISIPDSIKQKFSALTVSARRIEKRHCKDNIALIVEYELTKMPVCIGTRHYQNIEET